MEKGKYKKNSKCFSIVIVPHDTGKVKSFKITHIQRKIFVFFFVFILIIGILIYLLAMTVSENNLLKYNTLSVSKTKATELNDTKDLLADNIKLLQQKSRYIDEVKNQTVALNKRLDGYDIDIQTIIEKYLNPRVDIVTDVETIEDFSKSVVYLSKVKSEIIKMEKEQAGKIEGLGEIKQKIDGFLEYIPTKWPVAPDIVSEFGYRYHPVYGKYLFHDGLDLAADYYTEVYASAKGTVIMADYYGGYGNCVMIDHGNGLVTMYGHANKLLVEEGAKVDKETVIMLVGSTGTSTGPHVHFEVRLNDSQVNPLNFLEKE